MAAAAFAVSRSLSGRARRNSHWRIAEVRLGAPPGASSRSTSIRAISALSGSAVVARRASSACQKIGSRLIEVSCPAIVTDRFVGDAERHQYICWPPLIDSVEPVTKPAFSSTRKATPRAISSALPSRLTGILATILPSTSGGTAATMSVSI